MRRLLSLCMLILALSSVGRTFAQSDKVEAQRKVIEALERRVAQGDAALASIRQDMNTTERKVTTLVQQIAQRVQLMRAQETQVKMLNESINQFDSQIVGLDSTLMKEKESYAQMIRSGYRNYRYNNLLSYLMTSDNFTEAARKLAQLRTVAIVRKAKIDTIRSLSTTISTQKSELLARRTSLSKVVGDLEDQRYRLQHDANNARANMKKMSKKEREQLAQKEMNEQALNRAIDQMRKLVKGNKEGASFSIAKGNLKLPVVGGRVKRYLNNMAEIVGAEDAKIISIYDGKVVDIKQNRISGKYDIYIAHGEYISSYAGLASVSVQKGAKVQRGTIIGVIGASVDLGTLENEYKIVFGIYPPNPNQKVLASSCFK